METSASSTISYDSFLKLALDLQERSKKLGDTWELKTAASSRPNRQAQQYLVKKSTQVLKRAHQVEGKKEEDDELGSLAGDTSGLTEGLDVAYLDRSADSPCEDYLVHVEYHIVHSMSYQVPVIYFNATFSSGQALALEDVWELLSSELVSRDADRWRLLTQQEHPYLGQPFYHIHPCHTAAVMSKAMLCLAESGEGGRDESRREVQGGNYLITWLSTFAPVIGLDVSLKYAL